MQAHSGEARLLKALANERRPVLCLLAAASTRWASSTSLDISQPALSQHLAVLREEGLVATRREAQTIHYSLAPGPAAAVMRHPVRGLLRTTVRRKRSAAA